MKTIGLITIGQSPRTDVTPDLEPIFGPDVKLLQAGALDGLTAQEIAAFAPEEGDYVLISKLRDGTSAVFAEKHILPRLQQCIRELEDQGAELIMFLCTGSFPAFESQVPLVFPCAGRPVPYRGDHPQGGTDRPVRSQMEGLCPVRPGGGRLPLRRAGGAGPGREGDGWDGRGPGGAGLHRLPP